MRAWSISLLSLLAACGGTTAEPAAPPVGPPPVQTPGPSAGRLPADLVPLRYELALTILPDEPAFTGTARIGVRLAQPRDVIWIHGKDLRVGEVEVRPAGGAPLSGRWEQVDEGLARIALESAIGPGEAEIRIAWSAGFRDDLDGLFRVGAGGQAYAFTQFEPLSARSAFPCFDEPSLKTPFDVSLTVRADHEAIANSRATEESDAGEGLKTIRYATTPPLPTYLVAWAVGPLDVVDAPAIAPNDVRSSPLPFRGVAVRGRGPELAYALEHTPALLALLEDYFGSPYPYDKLDVIAIPGFNGAMENAGAITFADTILLVDAETAPARQKQWFAYTMAHELAHQWFGNLVTMAWWDDLWLNEAFASWMETKIVGRWRPDWQADRDEVEWVLEAMQADSLASARFIRQPIESEHDIHNAFDWITYTKGAGVLRMVERWLGEDAFRQGIRRYLEARRFGSATASDLTAALSEAAGRDTSGPMQSFLLQSGIPFVEVRLDCPQGAPPAVVFEQSRYLPAGSEAEAARTWSVPVCIAYGSGGERRQACLLLTDRTGGGPLDGEACPDWVMPNADAAGYYRWTEPPELLERLRTSGLSALTVPERMSVADNLAAAFAAGRTPAADVLASLEPLARDDARHVATAPIGLIEGVGEHLVDDAARPRFERWVRGLYGRRAARLGWQPRPGEGPGDAILRAELLEVMALVARDPGTRREAARRARRLLGVGGDGALARDAAPADLVQTVLVVAAEDGDAALFDAMEAHLHATEDGMLRRQLLRALGSFRAPELAARARALTLDARLRPDERFRPLRAQLDDPATREDAWRYLTEQYDAIAARAGSSIWMANLPGLADVFCTAERASEVERFFAPRVSELSGGPRNLASAVETIRLCAALVDAQRQSTAAFFAR